MSPSDSLIFILDILIHHLLLLHHTLVMKFPHHLRSNLRINVLHRRVTVAFSERTREHIFLVLAVRVSGRVVDSHDNGARFSSFVHERTSHSHFTGFVPDNVCEREHGARSGLGTKCVILLAHLLVPKSR